MSMTNDNDQLYLSDVSLVKMATSVSVHSQMPAAVEHAGQFNFYCDNVQLVRFNCTVNAVAARRPGKLGAGSPSLRPDWTLT